jgi:exonuclease SbcC
VPAELADPAALQASRAQVQGQILALKRALDGATEAAAQAAQALIQTAMRLEASGQARARLALEQLDKARDLEMRLAAAGFRDVQAWLAARLDDAAVAALDVRLRAFEASLAGAGERHRRAVADTEALARPDLAASLAGHEDAKAAQLRSSNAVRDALAVQAESARYVDTLKRLQASYQALEVRYGVLKKVSDVANGNNAQRMSLQRYVLATLLDEVVAATTLRLRVMSRGRYEMRRKVEAGDQRTAAGLDLEIFDHYTGSTRAVSTLSGGESFLAALALALGLSDIVQSYAGGIRLDAIFVDEGFGSLDPEALDHAIRALKDLQQSGRMVGIISHVAELKEWIDARLELSASPGGSQARFVL